MGDLYIVATPIGNLQDITYRAIKTLEEVDYIASEDTRVTGMLLKKLEIPRKAEFITYFEHSEARRIPEIIELLKLGKNVALVSDSGTPTVSDPGFKLVRECVKENIKVISIPGPSSVISSLVVSGLPTDKFLFIGFLPERAGKRQKTLENVKKTTDVIKTTVILFESPHRLIKLLNELNGIFGDIEIVVCRELTKIFEEVRREKLSKSLEHFQKTKPRGEFIILFNVSKET